MTSGLSLSGVRQQFHRSLLGSALSVSDKGIASISDSSSPLSCKLGFRLVELLGGVQPSEKQKGQSSGVEFEIAVSKFLSESFPLIAHLSAGNLVVQRGVLISQFQQYRHLAEIDRLVAKLDELKSALGADYLVKPDVLVVRRPEPDETINKHSDVVSEYVANRASLRAASNPQDILRGIVSCKWTLRSDRAQNARTEVLNLLKNRKGPAPHIVVVTAEPMPSRISSLAFGTGEIDMVYHFALPELIAAIEELNDETSADLLRQMIHGQRLRDISDLPLDLVV